jgi:uncharacterized protein YbjT (DUF2867 family)
MKIVVIGGTHYIRASTVKKLQRKGHEVEAAPTRDGVNLSITDYRDPGYAGQHLRHRLLRLASLIHELWRQGRTWRSKLNVRF